MESKVTDFIFETNGQCFLCLHNTDPPILPDKLELKSSNESSPSINHPRSIQCLSRYLRIDMRKVFIGEGPISPNLLAKVQKSKLKVELCEECSTINDTFSELNMQLEKIKMEMKALLQLIVVKLNKGGEMDRIDNSQPLPDLQKTFLQRKLEIVEAMRKETKQRCSIELSKLFPRISIQKLTKNQENEIGRNQRKRKPLAQQMSVPQESILNLQPSIKSEPNKSSDDVSDSDYGEDNNFDNLYEPHSAGISDDDSDGSFDRSGRHPKNHEATHKETIDVGNQIYSAGAPKSSRQTESSLREKCIINSITNQHTCRDCKRIFMSLPGFYHHYKAEHLKIRYECSVCNQKFKQIGNYNKHQKVAHKGKAYKCRDCNQIFSLESNLLKHRGSNGCINIDSVEDKNLAIMRPVKPSTHSRKIQSMCVLNSKSGKYNCTLCKSILASKNSFRDHYNRCHLKIKYKCIPCQKEFSNRRDYRNHHATVHSLANNSEGKRRHK